MGGKQSKLKKEIEALKADATKLREDAETLRSEKRMLEFKLHALQEMTAKAQIEAEKATELATENEEKAKALKWELVRRLSVPVSATPVSPSGTALTASTSSSLSSTSSMADASTSSIPRVPVNWKLKDGVTLRRSNTSINPKIHSKAEMGDLLGHQKEAVVQREKLGVDTSEKKVDLMALRAKTQPAADRTGSNSKLSSNQDELVESKGAKTTTSTAPVVETPSPSVAPAISDHDKFAPVKRRSLSRDTPPVATSPAADVTHQASEMVQSVNKTGRRDSDDKTCKGSDSEREQSKAESSSSESGHRGAGLATKTSRGVRAATKGMGPQRGKADDVLALSDDEDD